MTITNGYATAAAVKAACGITDNDDDLIIEASVETASRVIDQTCGRRFYLDTTTSARLYFGATYYGDGIVYVDDFDPATTPTVKFDTNGDGTFPTTWVSGTDYLLGPLNQSNIEPGPQFEIRLLSVSDLKIPVFGRPALQVTAKWGWPEVPTAISRACSILAVDYFRAKDAPFGIGGATDYGVFRVRDNAIVMGLLGPYIRPAGIA